MYIIDYIADILIFYKNKSKRPKINKNKILLVSIEIDNNNNNNNLIKPKSNVDKPLSTY